LREIDLAQFFTTTLPTIKLSTVFACSIFIGSILAVCLIANPDLDQFSLSPKLIQKVESKYGPTATNRLRSWESIIRGNQNLPINEKLNLVNNFFNGARFVDDRDLWNKKDYWATPVEFIGQDAGDCEDFSIAKYFTLKELGVPTQKLRITYTKSVTYNQAHMVLAYYESPNSEPLILDNINKRIKPASQRTDLKPVYSFNADDLWLNRSRNSQLKAGKSSQIKLWLDLTNRIETGAI
jgi:predicted transglutaminase-like cysteine proteinase